MKKSGEQAGKDPLAGGFGSAGWRMILLCAFSYFVFAGWSVDGINIFSSALAARHGWQPGTILTVVAPGGLMCVVGSAVFGQWIIRRGPRFIMSVTLACMAVVILWFGRMQSLWEFALVFMLINFFGAGFGFIAPGTLLAHWFPRKKGMALALATCGYPLSTAVFVPLIATMFARLGIEHTTRFWSVLLLGAAALTWWLVRDTPEQMGQLPDNQPGAAAATDDRLAGHVSPYTVGRLLKDRDQWLISVGWGCLWMVTVGIVVQLVPRLESIGFSQSQAIILLSVAAVCAIPGSVLWGYLDQRLGTRTASALYGALYILTLLLLIAASRNVAVVFVTVLLVGLGLGGIKSLITSMTITVYGRYDFSAAYRLIIPVAIIVRTACFPIMGLVLDRTGSLTWAYLTFVLVDLLAIALVLRCRQDCKGRVA